jgi:hypothetical protein
VSSGLKSPIRVASTIDSPYLMLNRSLLPSILMEFKVYLYHSLTLPSIKDKYSEILPNGISNPISNLLIKACPKTKYSAMEINI